MKKGILALAVSAAIAVPMAAQAGDPQVFGRTHFAVDQMKMGDQDAVTALSGTASKGSFIGVKGSTETSMMGMDAIYQMTIGFNFDKTPASTGEFQQFDSFVGLSSKSMGTVRGGTVATSYKETGAMIDPLFTTMLEGRNSFLGVMSAQMHGGNGDGRGRSTHTIRYDSPDIAGAKVIFDYNIVSADKDNMGLGVRYMAGPALVFVDWQSLGNEGDGKSGTATKIGGKFSMSGVNVGLDYEMDGGALSGNTKGDGSYVFLNVGYTMGATLFTVTYGMASDTVKNAKDAHTGIALAVKQSIAKTTALYAGYGMKSYDDSAKDKTDKMSGFTVGMTHSF